MHDGLLLKKKVAGSSSRPFRFIKLNKLSTSGGNGYISINELQIISSGVNLSRNAGVVASASTAYPGQPASYLIDNLFDDGHRWASVFDANANVTLGSSQWVKLDFGQTVSFDSIKVAAAFAGYQRITACVIQGSVDDVTYYDLKTVNNIVYPDNLSTTLVEILR
jgi:hypothetical protein